MKRSARVYSDAIILIGLLVIPYCAVMYTRMLTDANMRQELAALVCLTAICVICRSMPIYVTSYYAIDISILPIVAMTLMRGAYAASLIFVLSSFFTVEFDPETHQPHHIYNTSLRKTLFNNTNTVLSILLPGLLIMRMGYVSGDLHLPWVILPMGIFTALAFLINSVLLLMLFVFMGQMRVEDVPASIKGLVPNVLLALPLSLLTCYAFNREDGYWLALLMILPLMLARYAWKMYLDSRTQYLRLIQAFVASVEARDKYTEGHSRRVNMYAVQIAEHMRLRRNEIETIRTASLLHDIGKLGIEDAILLKPGKLDEHEFERIRQHPVIGVNIVSQVGLESAVVEMIRHHHERFNGSGYPDNLDGEHVSLGAQILAVADAYDAMTSARPYRGALPRTVAIEQLLAGKSTQFAPVVVDAFVEMLRALPPEEEQAAVPTKEAVP